jgi:hypothetical protein
VLGHHRGGLIGLGEDGDEVREECEQHIDSFQRTVYGVGTTQPPKAEKMAWRKAQNMSTPFIRWDGMW